MKRLALYVFYEQNGIVRNYVTYYLKALKAVAEDIVVIVNGKLSPESRNTLEELGVNILVKKNEGLDFGAWQYAIKLTGWEIYQYDELILCNCSTYGPIYPLIESFSKMEAIQCDFWGYTKHPKNKKTLMFPDDKNSYIEEHIQSYFVVFRHRILCSQEFKEWWENLVPISEYRQEVTYHEAKMTKFFEDAGYVSAVFMDTAKYFKMLPSANVSFLYTKELITEGIPFLKRKFLAEEALCFLSNISLSYQPSKSLTFIKNNTAYPTDMIWEDLLATQKFPFVKDALQLNYILPSVMNTPSKNTLLGDKTPQLALLCYAYYPDLCEYMVRYINNMPEYADIYIISSREDTLAEYKKALVHSPFKKIEFRIKGNRGRDVSGYLITGRDILESYDVICCVHDKKSLDAACRQMADDFLYSCMECCLHSNEYVQNVIEVFEKNSRCGLLVPPTPYYATFHTLGAEITQNINNMKLLYNMLNLSVPMDESNAVAPFGSCFWVRGKALSPLFRHEWKDEDFPEEPLPINGTISHAIERIYPVIAQEAGFYTAWCSPDTFASLYMNNLAYRMRKYNTLLYKKYGVRHWNAMCDILERDIAIPEKCSTRLPYKKYGLRNRNDVCKMLEKYLESDIAITDKSSDLSTLHIFSYYRYKFIYLLTFGKWKYYKEKYLKLKKLKRQRRVQFL